MSKYLDRDGSRYGIPTYPKNLAPEGLATRTQLRSLGLRPGGQDPAAQLMWRSRAGGSRAGVRVAYLYFVHLARPVRPMTPGRERALARAMLARCTCTDCGLLHEYCLPTSTGRTCPPGTGCATTVDLAGPERAAALVAALERLAAEPIRVPEPRPADPAAV